jgi:RHH-type proline utilization regulon transcriptional repressor/proline dehydrogenase/delta 1-pyrroline-5-carboxylate dehydrogenase
VLYVPVVRPDEFDVAISYLVRRLEENASSDNFLSAVFEPTDPAMFARERDRSSPPSPVPTTRAPRRREPAAGPRARRGTPEEPRAAGRRSSSAMAPSADDALTQAVAVSRAAAARPPARCSADVVETAVFAAREAGPAAGAAGFRNAPDSDPRCPRTGGRPGILARVETSAAGCDDHRGAHRHGGRPRRRSPGCAAAEAWGARPAAERAPCSTEPRALEARRGSSSRSRRPRPAGLRRGGRRGQRGRRLRELLRRDARELDRVPGAVFVPARLTVVTPPWNFPIAIPAGGVLAARGRVRASCSSPRRRRRCAAVVAGAVKAFDDAGIPRDLLALVDIDEGGLGRQLIAHAGVDRVILTGRGRRRRSSARGAELRCSPRRAARTR